jgi:hypothetical protein
VVDAYHVDHLPLSNGLKFGHSGILGYPNLNYLEKPIDVYDYAITDTSEEPDYPRRGRSPPALYTRERLPFEIPLPPSPSMSDYTDGNVPFAEELTPVASRNEQEDKTPTIPLISSDDPKKSVLGALIQILPTQLQHEEERESKKEQDMEQQTILASSESRDTGATHEASTGYPGDLAFVGTHIEIPSGSHMALQPGPDFDELTNETHNDRLVLEEDLAAG